MRALVLLTSLMSLSLPAAPAAADEPITVTFSYTGAPEVWTVPSRVTAVMIETWGAQGGGHSGASGGLGGYAKGTISVTGGETLQVMVGGQGGHVGGASKGLGGFNGGGDGGLGDANTSSTRGSAGGGGASDVRRTPYGLGDRLMVGAGGGGASGANAGPGYATVGSGSSGSLGQGGAADTTARRAPGGGGGGGYYGGGSGQSSDYTGTAGPFAGGHGGAATGADGASNVSNLSGTGKGATQTAGGAAGSGGPYDGGGGGGSNYVSGTDTVSTRGVRTGNGLVKITIVAAAETPLSPSTPEQVIPTAGHTFGASDEQRFVIESVDVEGEFFTGTIELRDTAGTLLQSLTTASTPPGGVATAMASPNLPAGSYQWRARACQTDTPVYCSAFSAYRPFTVAANGAPGAPEILYPLANAVFQPGQRQDFTVRATDPDDDAYTGQLKFRRLDNSYASQQVDTHPAPSGVSSSGTLATNPLPAGTYTIEATARDRHRVTSAVTEQQVGVAALAGPPCSADDAIVDGWFGDRYLQVGTATVGDVGYVCVRTAQAGQEVGKFGGWLRAEVNGGVSGGGTPTVGTTAACDENADGLLPFPLLDQTVGPPAAQVSVWGGLLDDGTSVTACLKLRAGGSTLLDHAVTIAAPEGAQLSDLNFIPESLAGWTPPLEAAPPAGLPSSECYEAPAGRQRWINAKLDGQHVWLYSQSGADATRLCGRVQGATSGGVVLRGEATDPGQPVTWQVGLPVDHPTSPCHPDWPWYTSDAPYHARVFTSAPDGDPAAVCLSAGLSGPTLAAWLTVDRSPGAPEATYEVD